MMKAGILTIRVGMKGEYKSHTISSCSLNKHVRGGGKINRLRLRTLAESSKPKRVKFYFTVFTVTR